MTTYVLIFFSVSILALHSCVALLAYERAPPEYDIVYERETIIENPIIIDTDAGVDDAVAILMLLGDDTIAQSIIGITCVRGNTETKNVAINVLKILEVANRTDIPVYKGAEEGLLVKPSTGDYYGKDGLNDVEWPKPSTLNLRDYAPEYLAKMADQHSGKLTILMIGPLTNVALALKLNTNFMKHIKKMVFLGGSIGGKNLIRPFVEFNVHMDPEAAAWVTKAVEKAGKVMTIVPTEAVRTSFVKKTWRNKTLGKLKNQKMKFLNLIEKHELEKKGDDWETFDVYAAAMLIHDISLGSQEYYATFEDRGTLTTGALVVDYDKYYKKKKNNSNIVFQCNTTLLQDMLLKRLN